MSFGGLSPFPSPFGGGPSPCEAVYRALREAAGTTGLGSSAAGPVESVEDLWRRCKAVAIAASGASVRAAAMEHVPGRETAAIPDWERTLLVPEEVELVDRRAAVGRAITRRAGAHLPKLQEELWKVDLAFELRLAPPESWIVSQAGKAFAEPGLESLYGTGAANGTHEAFGPALSGGNMVRVRYNLAPTQVLPPAEVLAEGRRVLCELLPSWQGFTIHTAEGFLLDGGPDGDSLLDLAAFGEP